MRLVIIVTNNCNFRCKTCLREYKRGSSISLSLLDKILPQAKKIGYDSISLSGGEPALHPEFEKLIEIIVKHEFKFTFISNGSMRKKYEFIIQKYKKNLLMCTFSIDGSSALINDAIRQKGSFLKVCRTIKYFVARNIYTCISVCLNKINKDDIDDMYKLAKRLKVKVIIFASAIASNFNKSLVLSDIEKVICLNKINELARKNNTPAIIIPSSLWAKKGMPFCNALNDLSTLAINSSGQAIFCCDTVREGQVIGNLENEDFYKIYGRYMQVAYKLKKLRLSFLKSGKTVKGFNSCEFCNRYVSKFI